MFANFDVTPGFLFTVLLACNKLQPSKTQACQPSPCQNGGTCFGNNICLCPPGLTGPTCTNVYCDNYPCLNGGTCIRGSLPNQDTCQCPDGFVLPFCTTSCTSCSNRGTCSNGVCSCDTGSVGPTCQNFYFAYVNPVAVTVSEGNNDHDVTVQVCRHPDIFAINLRVYTLAGSASGGSDFQEIPFSQNVNIPVGAVCTPVTVTINTDQMFEPTEEFNLVLVTPDPLIPALYSLIDNVRTTITITNDDPVYCDRDRPCFNGGTCRPSALQNPCTCPVGFVEPFCTTSCLINSCQNGGTCSDDVCSCQPGFAGPTCQSAIAAYLSPKEITVTEGDVGNKAVTVQVCRQPSSEEVTLAVNTGVSSAASNAASPDVDFVNIPFNPRQDVTISAGQTCTPVNVFIISDLTQETMSKFFYFFLRDPQQSSSMVHIVPGHSSTIITITDDDPDSPPTTKPVTTTEVTTASTPSTPVTTTEASTSSTPSTPVTTTQGRTSSTPSISNIPFTPPPDTVPVSGPCAEYLDYRNANSETVFELVLSADLELVTETIINSNQCPDLLPAMCSLFYPPLPSSGYTLCQETCSQLFEDCQIAIALLAGAMPESCSKFPPKNEAGDMMCIGASEPPSSPVYLIALVIPVLLIFILLVVIIKRMRRKPASESKPVDVQDVDYVNTGVTDDPEDYIALEEQSRNTPAPKYQDLTETDKEAPTQVSGYERTILETADAAPKAMPRQGIKRQTDYQYEDVNLGETDARKLPSVPQPDLQSEDDTEYEVPDMFEEYTGVYINTLGASKPITPRPMKIIEYKTFMGRERSKVISEIVQQYMALKTGQQHPWTAAVKLQNKPKNFFKALLPYDHSRVRLDTDGRDVRSDYINASYIKNHKGKVSFIAAQGPREGTKDDFWRMVWKEDVETMVTLVDKDGTEQHSKDAEYWPHKVNTSQKYGAITVLLMETTAFRSYILREMNVIKGNERVHTVRQYEIRCWKYGGVPSEPADLISVIKHIKNHQKGGKQLLVHCSNGVGGTGVFIGLYDLMDVIKTKKEVCVFDVIEGMRKDRVNMVLTKLQYLFIFDALLEAMLSPDSQMSCDQLKKLDLSAMKAKCKKEFQILQETTKHQEDLATLAGNSSENNHKNRFPDLLPVDKFRPVLKSPGNLFGSNDYINATFAKDISQRGFIMTQTPLSSTIEDIWRLVFDYNNTSIVMLNTIDDSDESLTVYWPNGHNVAASYGLMTVICKKIDESDVFTRRQFEVKHKRSQKSLLVDHFSFHGWLGNKPDVHKLREFVKYTRTKGTGPALVHCINGVGLSAVYVTVITELERIEKEGAVDVFGTLHRLRKQCPHAVQTQDEYLLCYEHLRDHIHNPDEYTVVF